jgi:hypothetical protein
MSDEIDALQSIENYDLTNVDTAFPVLKAGTCDFVIAEMKTERSKNNNGSNIHIQLKTAMPWTTTKDASVNPGFPVRDSVFIPDDKSTEKGAKAMQMSMQKLAQLKLSAFGTQDGKVGPFDSYHGKIVTARIKVESSEEYGDQNRVQSYVRRTA